MKQEVEKKNNDNQMFDFESEKNLVGLFTLLQKIDKRNNPDLYKKKLTINKKK